MCNRKFGERFDFGYDDTIGIFKNLFGIGVRNIHPQTHRHDKVFGLKTFKPHQPLGSPVHRNQHRNSASTPSFAFPYRLPSIDTRKQLSVQSAPLTYF